MSFVEVCFEASAASAKSGVNVGTNNVMKDSSRSSFKYNIYSHTMSDFLFEEDIDNTTVTVDVPDGDYDLHLYQTGIAATLPALAEAQKRFGVIASTVPTRSAVP